MDYPVCRMYGRGDVVKTIDQSSHKSAVTPLNLEEQKINFLKYGILPTFTLNGSAEELALIRSRETSQIRFDFLAEAENVLNSVKSRYGDSKHFLEKSYGPRITKEMATEKLKAYLESNKLTGMMSIVWCKDLASSARMLWSGPSVKANKPENRRYSFWLKDSTENAYIRENGIQCLADHEIGTHFLRALNDGFQPWYSDRKCFGLKGHSSYELLCTEEGLASIHSTLTSNEKYLWNPALLYYTACKSTEMTFRELFDHLAIFVSDPEQRWKHVMRVKRLLPNVNLPGGYGKDQCYFEGAVSILRDLTNLDFEVIMSGRISKDEVSRVKRLARLNIITLPHFMRNIDQYRHALNEIAMTNGLLEPPLPPHFVPSNFDWKYHYLHISSFTETIYSTQMDIDDFSKSNPMLEQYEYVSDDNEDDVIDEIDTGKKTCAINKYDKSLTDIYSKNDIKRKENINNDEKSTSKDDIRENILKIDRSLLDLAKKMGIAHCYSEEAQDISCDKDKRTASDDTDKKSADCNDENTCDFIDDDTVEFSDEKSTDSEDDESSESTSNPDMSVKTCGNLDNGDFVPANQSLPSGEGLWGLEQALAKYGVYNDCLDKLKEVSKNIDGRKVVIRSCNARSVSACFYNTIEKMDSERNIKSSLDVKNGGDKYKESKSINQANDSTETNNSDESKNTVQPNVIIPATYNLFDQTICSPKVEKNANEHVNMFVGKLESKPVKKINSSEEPDKLHLKSVKETVFKNKSTKSEDMMVNKKKTIKSKEKNAKTTESTPLTKSQMKNYVSSHGDVRKVSSVPKKAVNSSSHGKNKAEKNVWSQKSSFCNSKSSKTGVSEEDQEGLLMSLLDCTKAPLAKTLEKTKKYIEASRNSVSSVNSDPLPKPRLRKPNSPRDRSSLGYMLRDSQYSGVIKDIMSSCMKTLTTVYKTERESSQYEIENSFNSLKKNCDKLLTMCDFWEQKPSKVKMIKKDESKKSLSTASASINKKVTKCKKFVKKSLKPKQKLEESSESSKCTMNDVSSVSNSESNSDDMTKLSKENLLLKLSLMNQTANCLISKKGYSPRKYTKRHASSRS